METLPESQPASDDALSVGATVDRYTLIQPLGAGGMGEVYEAVDPKLERHVALKLLKPSSDGRAVDQVLNEARAMAKVSHRNVVAVFDAGLAAGQPWVAMELIRGATLRQWMRSAHPWARTLRVLCDAGRGVQAAHQAGLVHRDLKPENILVGDDGRVAVTDFGLAYASWSAPMPLAVTPPAPDRATPSGAPSTAGELAGTPGYMAPEQLLREPSDARTDQFAFAVTTYEALYGTLPFPASRAEPILGAPKPPPPSAVPTRVWRALEKALRFRPQERHPSMAGLLAELEASLPRRRGAIALAVGAAALVAAATTFAATRPPSCEGGPALVAPTWNAQRKAAVETALASSPAPLGALVSGEVAQRLDAYAQGWAAAYRDACVATREGHQSAAMLDLRNACLRRRLGDLDALVSNLSREGGKLAAESEHAVDGLESLDACDESATLLERLPVPKASRTAVEALDRGLSQVKAIEDLGQYRDALEPAKAQVAEARKVGYPPALAEALVELGRVQDLGGSGPDAVPTEDEAVNTAEIARDDRLRARARMQRVLSLINVHNLDEAEREVKAASAVVERVGATDLQRDLVGLEADVATAQGRLDDAVALAKQALDLVEHTTPLDERKQVGALGTYAWSLFRFGKLADAGQVYQRAIPIAERVLGPKNPGLAVLTGLYAKALGKLHRLDEARAYHQRTVEIITASLGPESKMMAQDLADWGMILLVTHDVDGAKASFEKSLEIRRKTGAPDDPGLAGTFNGLAVIAAMSGRYDEAAARFKECLGIREKALGPTHPRVLGDLNDLAGAYSLAGKHAEALAVFDDALARAKQAKGTRMAAPEYARVQMGRAEELLSLQRYGEARAELALSHDAAIQSDQADLHARQSMLEATIAWDGFGERATALRLMAAARPDVELGKDPDQIKELNEFVQRVQKGRRAAPPKPPP